MDSNKTSTKIALKLAFVALGLLLYKPALSQESIVFTEITSVNFGDIFIDQGSSCQLDRDSNLVGDCNNSNPDISAGLIELLGFPKNTDFFLTLSGSQSSSLALRASGVASIRGNEDLLSDGVPTSMSIRGSKDTVLIEVFGEIEVLSPLETQTNYQMSYTIDVTFQ